MDYTTTTGAQSRWANGYGAPMDYPDMTENDRKGLTYTTEPLSEDINVTGHPVVTLYHQLYGESTATSSFTSKKSMQQVTHTMSPKAF